MTKRVYDDLNVRGFLTIGFTDKTVNAGTLRFNSPYMEFFDGTSWRRLPAGATYAVAQSAAPVTAPSGTAENTLATITLPANSMGANGSVEIRATFTYTNSANNKTLRIRFGGTTFKTITNTTSATQQISMTVYNRNATNSQVADQSSTAATPFSTSANALITASIDTTANVSITITGQKADGTETITLEAYRVMVNYGA